MRWLWLLCVAACCGAQPAPSRLTDLDLRCAEDCGSEGAVFDRVTHERAVTGEDSWLCYCMKGEDTLRLW